MDGSTRFSYWFYLGRDTERKKSIWRLVKSLAKGLSLSLEKHLLFSKWLLSSRRCFSWISSIHLLFPLFYCQCPMFMFNVLHVMSCHSSVFMFDVVCMFISNVQCRMSKFLVPSAWISYFALSDLRFVMCFKIKQAGFEWHIQCSGGKKTLLKMSLS